MFVYVYKSSKPPESPALHGRSAASSYSSHGPGEAGYAPYEEQGHRQKRVFEVHQEEFVQASHWCSPVVLVGRAQVVQQWGGSQAETQHNTKRGSLCA